MASKNRIFLLFLLLFCASGYALADDKLAVGTVVINPELDLDFYSHVLGADWSVTRNGYKNENYSYTHYSTNTIINNWQNVSGQTLFVDMSMRPLSNLSADLGFTLINQYADSYWLPVNIENRLSVDGQSYIWNRGDIKYDITNKIGVEYLRGVGHGSWDYKGDLFSLYPEQFDTKNYLDIAGHPIPDEVKFNATTDDMGNIELIYGSEPVWNYKNGAYGNYSLNVLHQTFHFIYSDHEIFYGNPGERMQDAEISSSFKIGGGYSVDLGVLYQPFRLGWQYQYVVNTAPGQGDYGSNYHAITGVTNSNDALGYSAKLNIRKNSIVDMMYLKLSYQGIVAGNKQEVKTHLDRKISKDMNIGLDYVYRKPVIGPMPLVYESVNGNLSSPIFQPRGPESPFWVGWGDPGTGDDREASILSAILTFNPSRNQWFYKYEPDNIAEYNLNPKENAVYSFAAVYRMINYPGSTDSLIYLDSQNNLFWDSPNLAPPSPTNGYINEFNLLNRFNLSKKLKADLKVGFGDSLATNTAAYNPSVIGSKSITNYIISSLTLTREPYSLKLEYDQDYWGPEIWQQQFGETFSKLYRVDIRRSFGQYLAVAIGYIGARQPDDLTVIGTELGDYDEIHCQISIKFGPIRGAFSEKAANAETIYGIMPNMNTTPPQVSLSLGSPSFSPVNGEVLALNPLAVSAASDIYEWKITVKNSSGMVVKTFSGQGQPPSLIEWNGLDDNNLMCRQDNYIIVLDATDGNGNSASSDPMDVFLMRDANSQNR